MAALPDGPFTIEVAPADLGTQITYAYSCGGPLGPCSQEVFFPDLMAEWAIVRVTTDEGVTLHEVWPEFESSRPNGRDCPPVCRNATVTISLPATVRD